MARGDVDIRVRLLNARRFDQDTRRTGKGLSLLEGRTRRWGNALGKAGTKLTDVGGNMTRKFTLPVGIGLGFAVKKTLDFDRQVNTLGAVSEASGKQLATLRQQALDFGQSTVFSATEAAEAQTELSKGGLGVKTVFDALPATLDLAAASGSSMANSAMFTANALKLFELRGKDSRAVADAFATAAINTTADVEDFAIALRQGGGVAHLAGKSFQETMGWLQALADAGVKNSDAGTSMKTAIIQLLKPSIKQANAAKDAGLNFRTQNNEMKSTVQIAAMLRRKTGDMTKAQRAALFATVAGTDGVRALNALYAAGPKGIAKYEKALGKQGTAAEAARKRMKGFPGTVEQLRGSMETLAIAVGTLLIPALDKLARFATRLSTGFTKLPKPVQQLIVGLVLLVAVMGPLIWIGGKVLLLGRMLLIMWKVLKVAVLAARVAWVLLNAGLLVTPLGWLILGLAALAIGFVILYKKVGWFRRGVQATWGWIKKNWPLLVVILSGPVGVAVLLIIKHFGKIKAAAGAVVGFIKRVWSSLKGPLGDVLHVALTPYIATFEAIKALVKWIVDKVDWLLSKADALSGIADKASDIGGGILDFVDPRAVGGVVSGGRPTLVGENGPEIARYPTGTVIDPIPSGPLTQALAGGGGEVVPIVIKVGERTLAEVMADLVRKRQGRK